MMVINGKGFGKVVKGKMLITSQIISFAQDVDESGIITNPNHELFRESISKKILVFPGIGPMDVIDSFGFSALLSLIKKNTSPIGFVTKNTENVFMSACFHGELTVLVVGEQDFKKIKDGNCCELNGERGTLVICGS